jgi:hypothetical protein
MVFFGAVFFLCCAGGFLKAMRPARKRRLVGNIKDAYQTSMRRACELARVSRATAYYRSCKRDRGELRVRLRDLAAVRGSYGYRRLHVLLRREDGVSIISWSAGSARKRDWKSGRRSVGSGSAFFGFCFPRRRTPMSDGAWILSPTACTTGADSGC